MARTTSCAASCLWATTTPVPSKWRVCSRLSAARMLMGTSSPTRS